LAVLQVSLARSFGNSIKSSLDGILVDSCALPRARCIQVIKSATGSLVHGSGVIGSLKDGLTTLHLGLHLAGGYGVVARVNVSIADINAPNVHFASILVFELRDGVGGQGAGIRGATQGGSPLASRIRVSHGIGGVHTSITVKASMQVR
jgi:hypothetical protein